MINVDLPMLVESTDASDPEFAKQSNTAMIIGVAGTLHAIALVASILRIYARLLVVKRFRLEDYFIVMSTVGVPARPREPQVLRTPSHELR